MKKVTFITTFLGHGGAERVIIVLANEMAKRGYTVSIICTHSFENLGWEYEVDSRIRIINNQVLRFLRNPLLGLISSTYNLYKDMNKLDSDIYISFITPSNVLSLLANQFLKKKLIISERGSPEKDGSPKIYIFLKRILYKKATGIVFQTKNQKLFYKNIASDKSVIIPNPIIPNLPEPFKDVRRKEIVAIGRISHEKNLPLLLHAFKDVVKKYPDYTLSIYGKGNGKLNLIRLSQQLDISQNVIFKGFHKDIHKLIVDSSMYVLSSDSEGMPNALLEAMAIGLPVVSTDCSGGGPSGLIKDGINGLLVPMNNIDELSNAMLRIIEDKELSEKLSENAQLIKTAHEVNYITEMWLDYINQI